MVPTRFFLSLAFSLSLSLSPRSQHRWDEQEALEHVWVSGRTATDHNLLPEIRAYMAKARLRRGIERVKLANLIDSLRIQEDEEADVPGEADVPANAPEAAAQVISTSDPKRLLSPDGENTSATTTAATTKKRSLSRVAGGAIFREVVLAKVREQKELDEQSSRIQKASTESSSRQHP